MDKLSLIKKLKFNKLSQTFILIILTTVVSAQYEINKYSVNNGGGKVTGGHFEINGSIAQIDVNDTQSSGNFSLNSGYWQINTDLIFKNSAE